MPITIGDFSSWSVVTEKVIIKHCDMSIFKNHGSALDARTREFWHVEHLAYPNRIELVFNYAGKDYPAHIEFDQQGRTRVFWTMELQDQFKKQPHAPGNYPDLRFERIGENKYSLSFINFHTVVADDQEKDETTITPSVEGARKMVYSTKYERNPKNRAAAIRIHGTKCMACGFDFEATYGDLGKDFIEVHHIKPLYTQDGEVEVNPETDLVCLCSNCHRMIHRSRNSVLSIYDLREIIKRMKNPFVQEGLIYTQPLDFYSDSDILESPLWLDKLLEEGYELSLKTKSNTNRKWLVCTNIKKGIIINSKISEDVKGVEDINDVLAHKKDCVIYIFDDYCSFDFVPF